jgi:chorismate mutase
MVDLLRQQIEDIDHKIIALLEQRFQLSTLIQKKKIKQGLLIFQPLREASILERTPDHFHSIFRAIFSVSRAACGIPHIYGPPHVQYLSQKYLGTHHQFKEEHININTPLNDFEYFWACDTLSIMACFEANYFPILYIDEAILFASSIQNFHKSSHAYAAWWHPKKDTDTENLSSQAIYIQKTCENSCFTLTYPDQNAVFSDHHFRGWVYVPLCSVPGNH